MKTPKLFFCLAFAGLSLVTTESAFAAGVAISSRDLAVKDRAALSQGIKNAKATRGDVFAKVAKAPALATEMDETKRGRAASITLSLRSLGKPALFPMLEMLAVSAPGRGKMSDSAWTTLRVGLLEAVGALRDTRSRAVLETIIKKENQFEVVRAATEALGQLGDDAATKFLVREAKKPGDKRAAVLAGLGECRREDAAKELARASTSADPATLLSVIASLADVGNAWAWQTPEVSKSGEEDKTRSTAAVALMQVFMKHKGRARTQAGKALLIVDHPTTPQLIQVARQVADARTVADLDELAQRFANNPVR